MLSQASDNLEVVEEGKIGVKGRICIWGLAILVYGSGMALWFGSMPVVKPAVELSLSFLYLFSSHDSETSAPGLYEDAPSLEDEDADEEPEAVAPEPTPMPAHDSAPPLVVRASSPWPSVKVVGVMTKQGKRSVMLGADIVPVADSTLGMTVGQIDGDRVQLEFEGEKKWLRVGDLTDRESR